MDGTSIGILIALIVAVGMYANALDRSALGYMFLSFIISPILTFILLVILGKKRY